MIKDKTIEDFKKIGKEILLDIFAIQGGPIPILLRLYELEEEHHFIEKLMDKFSHQSKKNVSEVLGQIPDFEKIYVDELAKMVIDGKSEEDIMLRSEELMEELNQQLAVNQEYLELIADFNKIEEEYRTHPFDIEIFREEVKEIIEEMRSEFKNATQEEKDEIATYILAVNEKYDELLKKIEGDNAFEKVNKRVKNEVIEALENDQLKSFDELSQEITEKTERIEQAQLIHIEDESFRLSSPWGLVPGHQYTYTVEELMVNKREDIDFFEFVSMEADFAPNQIATEQEKYVYVISESITGVAPQKEGSYNFKASLKYTSFRYGGEPKIFETTFTLNVGEKYSKGQSSMRSILLYVIVSLVIIAVIIIAVYSYKKYKDSKKIIYETWKEENRVNMSTLDQESTSYPIDIEETVSGCKE